MVIRTITEAWLRSRNACEPGIEVFKYMVGGDRVTMRFTGEDFKWMEKTFKYDDTVRLTINDSTNTGDDLYNFVWWLYAEIAMKSSELLEDLNSAGIDMRDFCVIEGTTPPKNWVRNAYPFKHPCGNAYYLTPDGVAVPR